MRIQGQGRRAFGRALPRRGHSAAAYGPCLHAHIQCRLHAIAGCAFAPAGQAHMGAGNVLRAALRTAAQTHGDRHLDAGAALKPAAALIAQRDRQGNAHAQLHTAAAAEGAANLLTGAGCAYIQHAKGRAKGIGHAAQRQGKALAAQLGAPAAHDLLHQKAAGRRAGRRGAAAAAGSGGVHGYSSLRGWRGEALPVHPIRACRYR